MLDDNVSLVRTIAIAVYLCHHITEISNKPVKGIKHTLLISSVTAVTVLPFILFVSVHVGIVPGQAGVVRAVHVFPGTLVTPSAARYCTTKRITII